MRQLIDKKKIFFYLIIFLLISSITSDFFFKLNINKRLEFNIDGLDIVQNNIIKEQIANIENFNLFKSRSDLKNLIHENQLVEEFEAKIIYPNNVNIQILETSLIAKTIIDNKLFFLGSNKKLIYDLKSENVYLPTIFGQFDIDNFLKLRSELKKNNFEIDKIDSFYSFFSNRWDIKFKNGLIIKLPEKNWRNSLKIATTILNTKEFNNLNLIDLRVNNKMYLK